MMSRLLRPEFAAIGLGIVCLLFFQNCSESLPDTATTQVTAASVQPTAVEALTLAPASVARGSSLQLQAAGGVKPYVFVVVGGPATVDSVSGLLAGGTTSGYAMVRVTDANMNVAESQITVGTPPPEGVVAGSQTFATAGNYTLTVPAYAKLHIEVKGAGGGGGGSNLDASAGTAGAAGGMSSASGLVANGGAGGRGTNCMNFNACFVNFGVNDRAVAGSATGGDVNTAGAGALGANGGDYSATHGEDGGHGGKAVKDYVYGDAASPAVGSTITIRVGDGGAGGINGQGNAYQNQNAKGGVGSVSISWGPL